MNDPCARLPVVPTFSRVVEPRRGQGPERFMRHSRVELK